RLFNCPDAHGLFAFTTPNDSWHCSVCLGSIPAGSRVHGCRRCNYDVCADCSLSPDDGSVTVVEGPFNCPGGHGHNLYTMPRDSVCDICRGSIPQGSRAFGCRLCDHDVCASCGMSPEGDVRVREPELFVCNPGKHGFTLYTAPWKFSCDVCRGSI
ncbi:unnamed protein product, partial [Ectocarpus fasciculatus]